MPYIRRRRIDRAQIEEVWSHLKNLFVTFGLFTPFSAFYKTIWPSNTKAETRALWVSIAMAVFTFGLWELWLFTDSRRLRRFFGLRRDRRLVVAMPSWSTAEGHTLGKHNYEASQFETRLNRKEPGTSQSNLDTLTRVVDAQSTLRGLRPEYKLDETLFSMRSRSPRFLHEHHDERKTADITIVSYGASSSNHLCRYVLGQHILRSDPNVYHFLAEPNANQLEVDYYLGRHQECGQAEDDLPHRFDEADGYDYALLIRLTIKRSFTHGRSITATLFVCAGLDQYGSEATLEYLFKHWREIDDENSGRDFYYLCRVSENPLHLEDFILHGVRSEDGTRFLFDPTLE